MVQTFYRFFNYKLNFFSGQGSIWKWSSKARTSASCWVFARRPASIFTSDTDLHIPSSWTTVSYWESTHWWTFARFRCIAQVYAALSFAKLLDGKKIINNEIKAGKVTNFLKSFSLGNVRLSPSPLPIWIRLLWHKNEDSDGISAWCGASTRQSRRWTVHAGWHLEHFGTSYWCSWKQRVSWSNRMNWFVL